MSAVAPRPPATVLFGRAALRHCPVCGSGGLFARWFHMAERCPRCELRFERHEGQWVGSLGMNTIVSFGVLLVVLVAGFLVTYPDFPVAPLTGVAVAVALVVPMAFFPWSRTLWTAVDLLMTPPQPGEVREEYRWGAAAPARRRPHRPPSQL